MKLIVGLGNPDDKYKNTYHNLGFMCVDMLAKKLDIEFSKQKCNAMIAETTVNGEKIIIAKPLTYMNLSGESISQLVSFYKIPLENLLVIYDDYDLNKGVIRIRESGSAGTHNGMRNIIEKLGNGNFPRIRIGFRCTENTQIPLLNLVLSGISEENKEIFQSALTNASNASYDFANGISIQNVMQKYNKNAR